MDAGRGSATFCLWWRGSGRGPSPVAHACSSLVPGASVHSADIRSASDSSQCCGSTSASPTILTTSGGGSAAAAAAAASPVGLSPLRLRAAASSWTAHAANHSRSGRASRGTTTKNGSSAFLVEKHNDTRIMSTVSFKWPKSRTSRDNPARSDESLRRHLAPDWHQTQRPAHACARPS